MIRWNLNPIWVHWARCAGADLYWAERSHSKGFHIMAEHYSKCATSARLKAKEYINTTPWFML